MQIRNQLDERCERHSEQQAHHTPQPAQKRIPTVAATGPILTRLAINFGISTFAHMTWSKRMVRVMTIYGPGVLN